MIVIKETQGDTLAGIIDGANTDFLTSFDFDPSLVNVYVNGRLKVKAWDDGFSVTEPRLVTMNEALLVGDSLEIEYRTKTAGTTGGGALGGIPSLAETSENTPYNIADSMVPMLATGYTIPAMSSLFLRPQIDFSELKPVIIGAEEVVDSTEPCTGGCTVHRVEFDSVAVLDIEHQLDRRPVVQVMQLIANGAFDLGLVGLGQPADIYRPMEASKHTVWHLTETKMRIIFNNYYTGEVLYI